MAPTRLVPKLLFTQSAEVVVAALCSCVKLDVLHKALLRNNVVL